MRDTKVRVKFDDATVTEMPLEQAVDFVKAFEGRATIVNASGSELVTVQSVEAFSNWMIHQPQPSTLRTAA